MRTKLVWLIIVVLLANTLIPNFIYAKEKKLEVNTEDFDAIQKNYGESSWNKMIQDGKADITTENGTKTKQMGNTISLLSSLAAGLGSMIAMRVGVISGLLTITTRGASQLLIKGDTVTAWSKDLRSTIGIPGGYSINWFTIEDTVFNQIDLFDTDFFDIEKNKNDVNQAIKTSVATFYYIMRVFALVIQLAMLIYLGIRMAISTVASEMAKYKSMLKDWIVSMVLLFVTPYIIICINTISEALVAMFFSLKTGAGFEKSIISQTINLLNVINGWSYVAVICMYLVMTFYQVKIFFMYLFRFLGMGFLIVISPLITITYSATKTQIAGKGGKAGAYNNWLEEYMVNAFIQPLHAGVYLVCIVTANEIFKVAPFLAVIFFMALSRAEKIVKNIFKMRSMSSIHSMSEYVPIKKLK